MFAPHTTQPTRRRQFSIGASSCPLAAATAERSWRTDGQRDNELLLSLRVWTDETTVGRRTSYVEGKRNLVVKAESYSTYVDAKVSDVVTLAAGWKENSQERRKVSSRIQKGRVRDAAAAAARSQPTDERARSQPVQTASFFARESSQMLYKMRTCTANQKPCIEQMYCRKYRIFTKSTHYTYSPSKPARPMTPAKGKVKMSCRRRRFRPAPTGR